MSDGAAEERADYLLALARAHGFRPTKAQRARWHRVGLLPRAIRRQGLGRGKGTISIYPAGTGKQLLALLAIHAHERRLPSVDWKLWWEGHNVSTQRARAYLERIVAGYGRTLQEWVKDGVVTKSGEDLIECVSRMRGEKHFSRLRKRVGKKLFPRFMLQVLVVLSGAFTRWHEPDDAKIVERGLGLTFRARPTRAIKRKLSLRPYTAVSVREMSRSFNPSAFRQALELTTDEDLERARNEVRTLIGLLIGFGIVFGGRAPLLTLFRDLDTKCTTPVGQAMLLMLWLAFRQREPALQALQVLRTLATKMPAIANLMTDERLAVVLRSRQAMEMFEGAVRDGLVEARGEINAAGDHDTTVRPLAAAQGRVRRQHVAPMIADVRCEACGLPIPALDPRYMSPAGHFHFACAAKRQVPVFDALTGTRILPDALLSLAYPEVREALDYIRISGLK